MGGAHCGDHGFCHLAVLSEAGARLGGACGHPVVHLLAQQHQLPLLGRQGGNQKGQLQHTTPARTFGFNLGHLLYFAEANKRTDIYGYVIGLYAAYGGTFLLGVWMLRKEYANLRHDTDKDYKPVLKDLFKYGFLNQTGHFVQFFNLRLSYYLLDKYISVGRVGVFSNALSLAEAIWIISNSIALVQYARIANADDRAYAQKLTLDLGKICLLISALAVVVLCLLPPAIYTFVFGPEFGEMAGLIRILAPGILLYCIFLILGHYYSGTGRYQMNTFAALCGLVVTFVCGFKLIPCYDVTGAAITSAVSYTVNAVFLFVFFVKESHFKGRDFLLTKSEIQNYIAELKQQFLKQPTENE